MKIHFSRKTKGVLFLLVILLISLFFHGTNMLHFPFFENDEGTYFAQAWSFLSEGKLAPYTYWYDHAPFGWIFTSLWIFVTGGLFTFGFSMNSARIFMLVIHLFNTVLLFLIGKRILKSDMSVFIATLFFSISPLGVYFQRRLLLDNLMVFWLLLSIYLVFLSKKLRYTFSSAIFFGVSVLTKENAIFFLPAIIYLLAKEAHKKHKVIAVLKWLAISGIVISLYPLYALLKGELFPNGSIFSPSYLHVSLLETLKLQASRGVGLPFWSEGSDFRLNLSYWMGKDYLLIVFGYISLFIHGALSIWNRRSRVIFALTLPMVLFLSSGKLVINFYIIPLLPFFSLSIGLLIDHIITFVSKYSKIAAITIFIATMAGLSYYYVPKVDEYLTRDETTTQINAVNWIKNNIDSKSNISIDFYSYLDLVKTGNADNNYLGADWFWKIELDPDIKIKKLNGDYNNLDYVMVTAEVQRQLKGFPEETSMLRNALNNSHQVASFSFDRNFDFNLDLYNQKYPNGDWVVIYKQNNIDLNKAWITYKNKFVSSDGRVSASAEGDAISEGQAYALLRSVWMNDKEAYDRVLGWTILNMKLSDSSLFAWKWIKSTETVIDKGNAPDADQDIALSLLFAYKQWGEERYKNLAINIITDLWKFNVYEDADMATITAGNWAITKDYITLNPSYFAPYAYRIFATVDTKNNWNKVVNSGYLILNKCSSETLDRNSSVFLPPEWCRFNIADKSISASISPQPESSDYGFNAFRVPWRIYLDYLWNNNSESAEYLNKLSFIYNKYLNGDIIYDTYSHDGENNSEGQNYGNVMNLPVLMMKHDGSGKKIYEKYLAQTYKDSDNIAYWIDGTEYYLQNWYWFMSGLYTGELKNLYR